MGYTVNWHLRDLSGQNVTCELCGRKQSIVFIEFRRDWQVGQTYCPKCWSQHVKSLRYDAKLRKLAFSVDMEAFLTYADQYLVQKALAD